MANKRLVRRVVYLAVAGAVAAGGLIIGTAVANAKSDPPAERKTVIVNQPAPPAAPAGPDKVVQYENLWD